MIKTVTVHELFEQLEADENTVLIDMRHPAEFALGHVPQAKNIPAGSMPVSQMLAEWSREAEGKTIYFICQSGGVSERFVDELSQDGYFGAQSVEGGMVAWQSMGLPLLGDFYMEPAESKDRRSKLVFGLVVMTGCALGFLVHHGFFAIPVVMAAESIFAGITGWSGLAAIFCRREQGRSSVHLG
jgi:rhodanese-related sulfurtransferase